MSSADSVEAAAALTARLAGVRLTHVSRREHDWELRFASGANLRVACPWRVLVDGRTAFAGSDDGQKFGLPTPLDGETETRELVGQRGVRHVSIRADSGDISITFDDNLILEVINISSGYEGWEINAEGWYVVGTGGSALAISVNSDKP